MHGWVKLVFGLSLMLNLLVGGIVVGGFVAHERRGPPPREQYDLGLGPLGLAFSPQDRRQMRQEAERAGADLGQMRGQLRAELSGLLDALAAEPWDPQAIQQRMSMMHETASRRITIGEKIMLQHLGTMTPAQRQAYVQRLRERLPEMGDKPDRP